MKFFTSILATALLSFAACLYLPWWSIAVVAFIVGIFIYQKPGLSFLAGFLSIFILWATLALIISGKNDDILAHKMSQVILKADSPGGLVLVTAIVGSLVSGFGAITGSFGRRLVDSFRTQLSTNSQLTTTYQPVENIASEPRGKSVS